MKVFDLLKSAKVDFKLITVAEKAPNFYTVYHKGESKFLHCYIGYFMKMQKNGET